MGIESQGTKLEIASTASGAKTITAMALGYPTILTCSAHGLAPGDVGTLANFAGVDAALLNSQVEIAQFLTTNTFAVAIDTTGKTINDNTDAATYTPVSWTEVGEITDFDGPGGSASVIDMTHLQSTAKNKRMGLHDEGQFAMSINFCPDDAGQLAAMAARKARTKKSFKVTYSDASVQTFDGYVMGFSSSGGVDGKVAGKITIEIDGEVTLS